MLADRLAVDVARVQVGYPYPAKQAPMFQKTDRRGVEIRRVSASRALAVAGHPDVDYLSRVILAAINKNPSHALIMPVVFASRDAMHMEFGRRIASDCRHGLPRRVQHCGGHGCERHTDR